ncbi:hypothetical protein [Klebsiella sp. PL-2018]|uniref:hypothetical protein n=1 Tax=Klebsiella sp. PL-2018 TaxID=2851540 RepID=UPI001C22AC49|nr:hypothetical protein [Klebsiella sp. PL-2018]QXD01306.1 hypothetical protein MKleb_5805 [Klebsiella sp. PL-2018]
MFRYFRLRVAQVMLILSFTLPFALLFSFHLSAEGGFDAWQFWTLLAGSTAVMWGGLALYTRDIDRKRQLPDARADVCELRQYQCQYEGKRESRHHLADIAERCVVQKNRRECGGGLWGSCSEKPSSGHLRCCCLQSAWCSGSHQMKWFALVADIQTGAATCLVYAAGNILFIVYIVAGGVFGICEMFQETGR